MAEGGRGVPPAPLRVEAPVLGNRREGEGLFRLTLEVRGWPGFLPGQFVMLSPGALGAVARSDPLLPRPMAVYREHPGDAAARVEVLYKRTGRGTALLSEAGPGQRIGLVGPLGRGFEAPRADERAVLVAGGTGIASVYELARRLAADGRGPAGRDRAPVVCLGARTAGELMGIDDFAALEVRLGVTTEDGSRGARGLVTELLSAELATGDAVRVYACGPTAMMRRSAQLAAEAGRPCVASLENRMACGFGVCLGCAAPRTDGGYSLVCRDGPMFDAAEIAWQGVP